MLGVVSSRYSSSASASAVRSVMHQWIGLSWRPTKPPSTQVGQDVENAGLVPRVERQVGIVPVTHDAQPLELGALNVDPLHGLGRGRARGSRRGSSSAALEPRSLTTLCSIGRPWQSQPGT